jgi:hypothetical protein
MFVGGGLTDVLVPRGDVVDVQLRPRSRTDEVSELEAPTIQLTMDDRHRSPYPPASILLNGADPIIVNFDVLKPGGIGLDDKGYNVTFIRRDYRTNDEIQSLMVDAADISADFPVANQTAYSIRVIDDPFGAQTILFTTLPDAAADGILLSRTKILRETNGVIPTDLNLSMFIQHLDGGELFFAWENLEANVVQSGSELDNDYFLGVLGNAVVSATWVLPESGDYAAEIGTALGAKVEFRKNGGGWNTLINTGSTLGELKNATVGDILEVRHLQSGLGTSETFFQFTTPTLTTNAFAILTY